MNIFDFTITSLTKNWFCYDAHFKHQQAKRWIWNRFVGVSQEEQVLNFSGSQAAVGLFRWIGRSPRLINDTVGPGASSGHNLKKMSQL